MAAAMLILLWIRNELGMDRFHENGDRIYMLYNHAERADGETWAWNYTLKILGPTLKADYAEVDAFTRSRGKDFLFALGDKKLKAEGLFVDSAFLSMFSFPLREGDAKSALNGTYDIVLAERFAESLFGAEEPMGKTVLLDSAHHFTVTGVLRDLPNNTLFDFNFLLPWQYLAMLGANDSDWENNSVRDVRTSCSARTLRKRRLTTKSGTSRKIIPGNWLPLRNMRSLPIR